MSKCPQCFHALPTDELAWSCVSPTCTSEQADARASAYAGHRVPQRATIVDSQTEHAKRVAAGTATGTWPPARPSCPECAQPMLDTCPTCRHALPEGWGEGHVTCVALGGARASGKSLSIAMGIAKLEQLLLKHANSQMRPSSQDVAAAFHAHYELPLLARTVLHSTPVAATATASQRAPLVFDLGSIGGRRQFLALRDVAGEELQHLPAQRQHLTFFGRADAVLYLLDPLATPDVRANLDGVIPLPSDVAHDPVAVLANVLTLVREGSVGTRPPIGVVISKFDTLEQFRDLDGKPAWNELLSHRGAAIARDPSERSLAYDARDGDLLDAEVRSLVHRLGGAGIIAMIENPSDGYPFESRFFATSVLGHAPSGERLDGRGMAPFRAIDPWKWALHRTGAI